jgi:hypothetical protein
MESAYQGNTYISWITHDFLSKYRKDILVGFENIPVFVALQIGLKG